MPSLAKISPTCQTNSLRAQSADSSSTNAVSFSSACTIKRPTSLRSATTTQIARPSRSTVATPPQLQPALLRLSAALLIVVNHLRRRFARFKLRADLLDLRCLLFETRGDSLQSFLLLGYRGFQFSDCRFLLLNIAVLFLHFAMLFEEFV